MYYVEKFSVSTHSWSEISECDDGNEANNKLQELIEWDMECDRCNAYRVTYVP